MWNILQCLKQKSPFFNPIIGLEVGFSLYNDMED